MTPPSTGDEGVAWFFIAIGGVGIVLAVLGLVIALSVFLPTAAIDVTSRRLSPGPAPPP